MTSKTGQSGASSVAQFQCPPTFYFIFSPPLYVTIAHRCVRSKSFPSRYRLKAESDRNPFSQLNTSLGSVKVDIRPSRDQISSCFSVRCSRLIGVLSIRQSVPMLAKTSDGLFEEKTRALVKAILGREVWDSYLLERIPRRFSRSWSQIT